MRAASSVIGIRDWPAIQRRSAGWWTSPHRRSTRGAFCSS
jgi:hypothetical protein